MTAPIEIPAPPGKSYLPYQLKAIRYALGARGTILADEMGLGKTVQAIGIINTIPCTTAAKVLIVCPAGLKSNWLYELEAWLAGEKHNRDATSLYNYNTKIVVASYYEAERMMTEHCYNKEHMLDVLVIDEAHYVKNPSAKRSQVIEKLAKYSKRVLALTGSPFDKPIDLWQLLKIVCPEKWCKANPRIENAGYIMHPDRKKTHPGEGPAFWEFALRYCDLKTITYQVDGRYGKFTKSALDFSGSSNEIELAARLRNTCMVRRLKADVLPELPPKRRQLIRLETKVDDNDLLSNLSELNYDDAVAELQPGKALFEEWSKRRHEQALAKLDQCLRFIGDVLDEVPKLIVFAHHSDVIEKLRVGIDCEFTENAYSVAITGATPLQQRQEAIDAFQNDPLCRVIIGSIGAMGVGFTLTAASHEIFVELDPRPMAMNQAEDRAHRIGQKESLLIQHLVADGSLCARIAKILVQKQEVISKVLDSAVP